VGLLDDSAVDGLPQQLGERLQHVLDTPEG
jgi:hypothetical protein